MKKQNQKHNLHENKNEKSAWQNEKQNQKQTLHENEMKSKNQKFMQHENSKMPE